MNSLRMHRIRQKNSEIANEKTLSVESGKNVYSSSTLICLICLDFFQFAGIQLVCIYFSLEPSFILFFKKKETLLRRSDRCGRDGSISDAYNDLSEEEISHKLNELSVLVGRFDALIAPMLVQDGKVSVRCIVFMTRKMTYYTLSCCYFMN